MTRNLTEYEKLLERKQDQWGVKFNASDIDLRFVSAYNNGTRIKVETCGLVLTGTVGVTTGWKPAFLLMRTSRSLGSPWILGPKYRIVAVKRGRKYMEVQS